MMLPAGFRIVSPRVENPCGASWPTRLPSTFRVSLFLLLAITLLVSCGEDGPSKPEPEVKCATPIFAPLPGTFAAATNVTITCATVGATIRYTTDGTTPVEASPLYTHPVAIAATSTLEARAWRDGFDPSDVATGIYTITGGSCSIGVTAPNGGEQWILGTAQTIAWGSNQCGPNVKIELLREGASCLTIAESTPNDGDYEWTAARCGGVSFDYEVRVTDLTSGFQDTSNDPFEIVESCAVQVLSPNGGETWTVGTSHDIAWASREACGTDVRIELLLAGIPCDTLAEATENDGSFAWVAARCGTPTSGYSVRVTDLDSGVTDPGDASFSLPDPACDISVLAPNGGESWDEGSAQEIRWRALDCGPSVRIEMLRAGDLCKTIADSTENDGSFAWTADRCGSVNDGYTVRVTDRASSTNDLSDDAFSIPGPPCTLTILSPNGGERWEEGTDHEITWTSNACSPPLIIDLFHGGELCRRLSVGEPTEGTFTWRVERCGGATEGYTIRLAGSGAVDTCDAPFAITPAAVPCVLTVTAPEAGEILWKGSRETIRWTASNCGSLARLDLLCNGVVCGQITDGTGNAGFYEWPVFDCCADTCAHSIRVTDLASNNPAESATFCIRTCTVAVTSPAGQDQWTAGEEHTIAWSTEGCGSEVRIELWTEEESLCRTIAERTDNDGSFPWTVASCLYDNTGYQVVVADLTSGSAAASEGFTILEPNPCILNVLSPNGGERWPAGSVHPITWSRSACGANVRIDLVRQGAECLTLAASSPNSGSFEWTVAACGPDSTDYRIAITDIEYGVSDQSDAVFAIPSCEIALDAPVGGERWPDGSEQMIAWHSSGACDGPVRIDLRCNDQDCRTIAASTEDDGAFAWTVDACCTAPCDHRIRVTNLATGSSVESPAVFCICPPCAPAVVAPNGGEKWKAGTVRAITWSAADCGASVTIDLLRNGLPCHTIASAAPNNGSYSWTVEGCAGEPNGYAIRVTGVCDAADESDATFTIPECLVSVTSPAPGVTWDPGGAHDITWTSSACGGTVRIELLKGGSLCSTLAEETPDDGIFNWTAQTCAGGNGCDYLIRIVDIETGRAGEMDGFFCICPPCPPIVVSPNGGESWQEGSGFDIVWTPSSCDTAVKVELTRDGSVCDTISAGTPNDGLFHWTAARCGTATAGYRVLVTGLDCGQSDSGNADFAIPPMPCALELTSPDGGESWSRNTTHLIRWDTAGDCGDHVKIELLHSGVPCLTIAESTSNDETYSWAAATCGDDETDYAIRLTELTGNKTSQSAAPFSIPICRLTVTAPNGGETWVAETQQTITWDPNAACGSTVRIELLRGGISCETIDGAAPNTGTYSWIAQNCNGHADGYRIRVTDTATGATDASDADLQIPTPPCSILVTAPNGGENWTEGSVHSITWTPAHCGETVQLELVKDGSPCGVIAASAPNTGSFSWNVESCVGTPGAWKIRVTDLASQAFDESNLAFQIATSPDAYILPQNLSVCRGTQNVEILVRGRNSQALQGYGVSLCYDTAVFICAGISLADTRGSGASYFENDCGSGCARAGAIISNACPPQVDAGDGPLLKLTLHVKADAPLGTTTLDLRNVDPSTNTMARCGGAGIDPTLLDGRVTICGGTSR